jgi:hypothetical protein
MNVRQISKLNPNYSEINREERNYAAILFAALCKPGNTERFLKNNDFKAELGEDFGIYFEYSYLRDLWFQIEDEDKKKEIIRNKLQISEIDEILDGKPLAINKKFGVGGKPSERYIEYPGKWSITKYIDHFKDKDDFLKICKFKWSFNIKPDIVIHTDKDHAICIEAKYVSGEGSYPSSEKEKAIFKQRGISFVGQTNLQKYMMEDLLGIETELLFLVKKKENSDTHKVIYWSEAFNCLDMSDMPKFAQDMVIKISGGEA